jgi:hypothetical protein
MELEVAAFRNLEWVCQLNVSHISKNMYFTSKAFGDRKGTYIIVDALLFM